MKRKFDYPETIGSCRTFVTKDLEMKYHITTGADTQGMTYHNWDAFYNKPDFPCYVGEYTYEKGESFKGAKFFNIEDSGVWTQRKIVKACGGNEQLAEKVFNYVDWMDISTAINDFVNEGEIMECQCGYLIDRYADWDIGNVPPDMTEDELPTVFICPKCGKEVRFGG